MSWQDKIHVLARGVLVRQEHLLVCKTLDLDPPFYFLPGGHVEQGESVQDTLRREFLEETGLTVTVGRFLGCLEYSFEPGHSSICHNHEYNVIFEVHVPGLTLHDPLPQPEPALQILWMPLEQVGRHDFRAEPLKELLPVWLSASHEGAFHSAMG